jgi:hypothetical protein
MVSVSVSEGDFLKWNRGLALRAVALGQQPALSLSGDPVYILLGDIYLFTDSLLESFQRLYV